ncbi:MAG TPA: cytochrome c-type biogenesis protein CcmH [Alphaproteobacteria bacterium]|jgi:cytochrome c-type biogenesis protein CcmH|nr:cytochrome c-type biogenesis protein CcmH [Alphaproteobacteria bacterium]HIB18148.1 cytochrome c-type biogenesis protein CcmH [Alphaproteobacteria bacterium]HIN92022.1 cytochrome c-type biogenesis protein CcmH [Alphaproteobacteria bacterium]
MVVPLFLPGAIAFENDAPLDDPVLESRARDLARQIRCLVCQNQSIFDSDADLAKDLRQIVRERIILGESDLAVTDYLVARYGDFVLLKPPIKPKTYLLWFGPALIMLFAGIGVVRFLKRTGAKGRHPEALSTSERKRVEHLISGEEVD